VIWIQVMLLFTSILCDLLSHHLTSDYLRRFIYKRSMARLYDQKNALLEYLKKILY